MKKEFKINDDVIIKGKVTSISHSESYPISVNIVEGSCISFTKDGLFSMDDKEPSLFHAEEEKPYPKWMMVREEMSDTPVKRFVLCKFNGGFVSLDSIDSIKQLCEKIFSTTFVYWNFAEDIPEKVILTKEEVLEKAGEYLAEKLGVSVENIEIK